MKKIIALILCLVATQAHAIERNVAGQKLELFVIDRTTGGPKTGDAANLTFYVSIDGDTTPDAITDNTQVEISSTDSPGVYRVGLSQAETNGVNLLFTGKSSTSDTDVVPWRVATVPAGFSTLTIASNATAANVTHNAGTSITSSGGRQEVNVSHVGGSTTPVTNIGTVFNTDFATNYNTTDDMWNVNVDNVNGEAYDTAIGAAVWDYPRASLSTGGSVGEYIDEGVLVGSIGANVITAASLNADAGTELGTAAWASGTRTLTSLSWQAAWDAEVQSEVDDAIRAVYLHMLFETAYTPASEPGSASGLLNVLMENDGGVPQFTANALEEGPSGGGGGGSGADLTTEPINTSRVSTLVASSSGLRSESRKTIYVNDEPHTWAADFKNDAGTNQKIYSITDVAIVSGTGGGLTFGTAERDGGTQARVRITAVTAGDYTVRFKVKYSSSGPESVGDVLYKVVD